MFSPPATWGSLRITQLKETEVLPRPSVVAGLLATRFLSFLRVSDVKLDRIAWSCCNRRKLYRACSLVRQSPRESRTSYTGTMPRSPSKKPTSSAGGAVKKSGAAKDKQKAPAATDLQLAVYELVRRIPKGKVCTYQHIGEQAALKLRRSGENPSISLTQARQAGRAMRLNPYPPNTCKDLALMVP